MKRFYLVLFSFLFMAGAFAQDKKVMVVSSNAPADDPSIQTLITKIDSLDGITASHVDLEDDIPTIDYADYDACVLTENGGSGTMATYSDAGWPLPTVCLKAYILYKGANPLFTQVTDVNWKTSDKSADLLEGINVMVVKDNSDILKCWDVDQEVVWTAGYNPEGSAGGMGAGEAHIQTFDLTDAVNNLADIVSNSTALADNKLAVTEASFPANLKTFMWKTEENATTKRLVNWGIHHTFMDLATADFYNAIKNSVLWVLKMDCECPGGEAVADVELRPYQMYPNPVAGQLNFSNAAAISNVEIFDITGKAVISMVNDNHQLLKVNTSNLLKGMYFVRVNTLDGKTYTDKLVK
ncbi:MAG: T9SS type A sorting domain-containing protein [Bacteroidales bacterium]|nr:T9SS type A sorting domain-containing protein [Bacteroidales bacterium]